MVDLFSPVIVTLEPSLFKCFSLEKLESDFCFKLLLISLFNLMYFGTGGSEEKIGLGR